MDASRRDFLKYAGTTTLALLIGPQTTPSRKTLDEPKKREYEAYVFGCPNKDRPVYVPGNLVKVNASCLDEALRLAEIESRKQFPESLFPMVHVDQVYRGEELIYKTAWDEFGPLGAVKLKAA